MDFRTKTFGNRINSNDIIAKYIKLEYISQKLKEYSHLQNEEFSKILYNIRKETGDDLKYVNIFNFEET